MAEMPPRGHYLAHEVGQLAGVSGKTIGQWMRRGYIRASQWSESYPHVYSYQDVAEAIVVHELILNGIPLGHIRRVIEELRTNYGYSWPLQQEELHVSDLARGVLVIKSGQTLDLSAKSPWQGVLDVGNLKRIAADLRNGGWAVRLAPELKHIEIHPDRLSGRPTIRGRRIAVADVAEIAALPNGRSTLREDYGLNAAEISDAKKWWATVQGFELAA
jgi:uncharacterized protein (DUF433 family)/DNA-binding transcriptional MerR regulator